MAIEPKLKNAYRHHRQRRIFVTGASAIAFARKDVAANVARYPSTSDGAGKSVIEAAEWGGACASAIDAQARGLIDAMRDALKNMTKLANGDGTGRDCYGAFYSGDKDLRAAFCDGASLSDFPEL